MTPITWSEIAALAVKYGLPLAYQLWQVMTKHPIPTEAAWQEIFELVNKSEEQYIEEAKKSVGQ